MCHCQYYCCLLYIFARTILPLVERNNWQSSKHVEASVRQDPIDPKDEKLQVRYYGFLQLSFLLLPSLILLHSVVWCCWLGVRKSIGPVKNWVMRCWRGCLSGVRCKWFAYGPTDATATHIITCFINFPGSTVPPQFSVPKWYINSESFLLPSSRLP